MQSRFLHYILPVLLFSIIWGAVEFFVPVRYSDTNIAIGLIAVLFSASSIISLLLDIPAGKLSDRIGRAKLIVCSMIIAAIALALLYFSSSLWAFIISALLIGIAYGLNWSPLLAFVGDSVKDNKNGSAFGLFFVLGALGEAIAPLMIVILVAYTDTKLPFLVLSAVALVCAGLFMRISGKNKKMPVPHNSLAEQMSYRSSWKLLTRSTSLSLFLLALGFFVSFFWQSVWFTQPLIGFYENSLFDSALIVAAFSLPTILFSKPLGTLIDRTGERKVFFYSISAIIISFLLFYITSLLIAKIAFIFTASTGVLGVWLVLDVLAVKINTKEQRGEFFGILETVRDASYAIAPLFIGFSYKSIGLNGVFLVNSIIACLLLFFGVLIFKRKTVY